VAGDSAPYPECDVIVPAFPFHDGKATNSLVGRDREIVTLHALFDECVQGKGIVAVIHGPVASGKTALLQAFAGQAIEAGAILLGAVASRAERDLTLGIVDQLFRGGPWPAAVTSRVARLSQSRALIAARPDERPDERQETVGVELAGVFEELRALLSRLSRDRPLVIAVDDLQHADLASLQFLSYLVRRAGTSRMLTVLTECPQTLPASRPLHAEILRQGNCRTIPLAMLPPSAVDRLLAECLDVTAARRLAPACHAATGGNPLLVTALGQDSLAARGLSPAEPAAGGAFGSAVVACLHRYEPPLVELGQAAAVLGEEATPGLLAEMLDLTPESAARGADALSTSGLLDSVRFRHETGRQAVLGDMTADERAALHSTAARTLHRSGASPATVARHLLAAGKTQAGWTVPVLQEAAGQALADGEPDVAIGYLRRAESEATDERQRAAIRFSLVCAEWPTDPERAARHLAELVAHARTGLLDGDRVVELAHYLLWVGDRSSAEEVLGVPAAGVSSAPAGFPAPHPAIRSPMDFLYPGLATRGRPGVDGSSQGSPPPTGSASRPGPPRPAPAGADGDATVIVAERILAERSPNDRTLTAITTALMLLICEDRLDQATAWCDLLRQESESSRGGRLGHAVLTGISAMIEMRRGNLPGAEDQARTALTMMTKGAWGVAIGGPLSSLLLATTANRKHEDAAACLRTPVPQAMFGTFHGLLYLYARGEYHLATGRPRAALADFADCGKRMAAWEFDLSGLVPWRTKAAEAHLDMGDDLRARELVKEQLSGGGSRFPRTHGISLRTLALTGHPAKRRTALLQEAAEVLRDSGARLELAHTLIALSNAHLASGEHGRAHRAARQARNLAEQCGAQALRTALGKIDVDLREPRSGVDKKLVAQLSDAEQRVAMLAADGYTNSQIAHKLFITVSTVEQHLTRVYRKLGVTGRAELPIEV
jgi:DNA-binding CsgD family transcriptional regulator